VSIREFNSSAGRISVLLSKSDGVTAKTRVQQLHFLEIEIRPFAHVALRLISGTIGTYSANIDKKLSIRFAKKPWASRHSALCAEWP
jgi:hypothetical protein